MPYLVGDFSMLRYGRDLSVTCLVLWPVVGAIDRLIQ